MANRYHSQVYGTGRNHRPLGANDGSGTDQPLTLASYDKAIQWLYPAGSTKPALVIGANGTTDFLPRWNMFANLFSWSSYNAAQLAYLLADGGSGRPEFGILGDIDVNGAKLSNQTGKLFLDESGSSVVILPRISSTTRDVIPDLVEGAVIWNTTTAQFETWNGSAWVVFGSTSVSLQDAYEYGGGHDGRVIALDENFPIVIGTTQEAGPSFVIGGPTGYEASFRIGCGPDKTEPNNSWELKHNDASSQFEIIGRGSDVGDSNEGVMISASDDRTQMTIGNATDTPDLNLEINKLQLNGVDPSDGQGIIYNSATGQMRWGGQPNLVTRVYNSATPLSYVATDDLVVALYAGDLEVNFPASVAHGKRLTLTNGSGAARDYEFYGGGSYSMADGQGVVINVANRESITFVLASTTNLWYVLSRGAA